MNRSAICVIVGVVHFAGYIAGKVFGFGAASYDTVLVANLWIIAAVILEGKK